MSQIQSSFDKLKFNNSYKENAQVLAMSLNMLRQANTPIVQEDLTAISVFTFDEMNKLIDLIPKTAEYKDGMFEYAGKLMELLEFYKSKSDIIEENLQASKTLLSVLFDAHIYGTATNKMFERIEKNDVIKVLDIVKFSTDEYQRGVCFTGLLLHYEEKINEMTHEAKNEIAEYICVEFERYLEKKNDWTEEEKGCLEIASHVCKYFIIDKTIDLLKKIILLKHNNIRYYAIETLLVSKQQIQANIIAEMAADLIYANLTYSLVQRFGLTEIFPKEFTNPEYLSKSNMVNWLVYSTKLGKAPDAIELLENIEFKGDTYYIFKYMSNSDTLEDELKNEWLIGWSSIMALHSAILINYRCLSKKTLKKL